MSTLEKPEWIIWIITPYCNLRCIHCYASIYFNEQQLRFNDVKKVIDDASEAGVEHINYTGGEPFVRRDIRDILKYTIDSGVTASIFTNATLLNDEDIRFLYRNNIPVYTSLDASTKELYEKIRGQGTWNILLTNILKMVNNGIDLHVNISVNKLNWFDIGNIIEKLVELGVCSISIIPTMPVGRALKNNVYIDSYHFLKALKIAEEYASMYSLTISVWCTPFIQRIEWAKHLFGRSCLYWNVLDITPSGDVVLCDVLGIKIANVLKDGVLGAWNKLNRSPYMKEIFKIPNKCISCPIASYCRGGCYARRYIFSKKFNEKDPLCPY